MPQTPAAPKYEQAGIATDLHRELTRRFSSISTAVSIEGAGVHWHCIARRDNSVCTIHCFAPSGAEYYTEFRRDSRDIATARVSSRADTLAAVADWLDGAELPVFYERYPFVDRGLRALSRIRDDVFGAAEEMERSAHAELKHQGADIYHLHFAADDRSCEVSFCGRNEYPDAKFCWDGCQLFRFQPQDSSQLAAALKRWLCDHSPPSTMRTDFPWLEIGGLADYYEQGKPIEGEFLQSWDWIEEFYEKTKYPFTAQVKSFIAAMRANGYGKTLRAGQSLWSLILSRSRRHGLRTEQPCIQFWFREDGMDVHNRVSDVKGDNKLCSEIALTAEIDELLRQLQAVEVD